MSRNPALSLEERIIERLRKPGGLKEIAQEFGVSYRCVYGIECRALEDERLAERYRRGRRGTTYKEMLNNGQIEIIDGRGIISIVKKLPRNIKEKYSMLAKREKEEFKQMIKANPGYILGKNRKYHHLPPSSRSGKLAIETNITYMVRNITKEFFEVYPAIKYKRGSRALSKFFKMKHDGLTQALLVEAKKGEKNFLDTVCFFLDQKSKKQLEDIISGRELVREAVQTFVNHYPQYKYFRSYSINNFLWEWDGKELSNYRSRKGIYKNVINIVIDQSKKKGKLEFIPKLLDIIGPPTDRLRNKLEEIIEDIGVSCSPKNGPQVRRTLSVNNAKKVSKKKSIDKNYNVELNSIFPKIASWIKGNYTRLGEEEKDLFNDIINKSPAYLFNKSPKGLWTMKDNNVSKLLYEIGLAIQTNEALQEFVNIHQKLEFLDRDKVRKFFSFWNGKRFLCRKGGKYIALHAKLKRKAKIERKNFIEYTLSLVEDNLRNKVEDIISGKRQAREIATEFVSLYDKKSLNGEEIRYAPSYTLAYFLGYWNGIKFLGRGKWGIYNFFLSRIKQSIHSTKQEDYIPIFLDMLDDDPYLRKQVEDIVIGERYRQELRQEGLEKTIEEYLEFV